MDGKAMLFNIQHFSLHDGAGIRTTVFFKGCPLRCFWCHNPESQSAKLELQTFTSRCIQCGACAQACPEASCGVIAAHTERCSVCGKCSQACPADAITVCGSEMTVSEVMRELLCDAHAYKISGGGVTFSGGEPLMQPEFLADVLHECSHEEIHTAVETCAFAPREVLEKIIPLVNLFYCDVKSVNDEKHRAATGVTTKLITENIRRISEYGGEMIARVPVIPEFNDDEKSMTDIAGFIKSLPRKHRVELLPFHSMCAGKYDSLGRRFEAANLPDVSPEKIERLRKYYE